MTNLPSSHSKIAESPVGSDSVMCTVAALPLGKVGPILESGRKASTSCMGLFIGLFLSRHALPLSDASCEYHAPRLKTPLWVKSRYRNADSRFTLSASSRRQGTLLLQGPGDKLAMRLALKPDASGLKETRAMVYLPAEPCFNFPTFART